MTVWFTDKKHDPKIQGFQGSSERVRASLDNLEPFFAETSYLLIPFFSPLVTFME